MRCHRFTQTTNRRQMLQSSACGFGSLALAALIGEQNRSAAAPTGSVMPLHHHIPRAKRIIFLFMWGGPSHVDTFDPKPRLNVEAGKPLAGESVGSDRKSLGTVLGSPFKFKQHGEHGVWMSELFPYLSRQADRMCVIRSMHTEGNAHGEALLRLHTGQANLVRPSVGAWVSYGLGSESENIPAFVTISPPRGHGGVQNYGNAFLPAAHQGTAIGSAEIPIAKATVSHLTNSRLNLETQRRQLDLIQSINQRHLDESTVDRNIQGMIANYELAFRMQSTMPQVMSFADETKETLELYGIDTEPTDNFGRQCLSGTQIRRERFPLYPGLDQLHLGPSPEGRGR